MLEADLPLPSLLRRTLNPLVVIAGLFGTMLIYGTPFNGYYLGLAIVAFFVSTQVFEEIGLDRCWHQTNFLLHVRDILFAWVVVIGILLFLGYVSKLSQVYSRLVLVSWFLATPLMIYFAHLAARYLINFAGKSTQEVRSAVFVGATDLGRKLSTHFHDDPCLRIHTEGFFDDRSADRLGDHAMVSLKGKVSDVAEYARQHRVNFIYITLPMGAQPRLMKLLDDLRDTTASVFFVPDIFVFDLMHARFGQVHGIPVVSVRDTPINGVSYVHKRLSDMVLAVLFLFLLAPVMLLIAAGVKLSSPGPVFFRQRRYGLHGEEILVYKFRSMTVCDDGDEIIQAKKQDSRVTRLGAFLRRTSLDELPQLLNVLQGSMSIVGPRPHAVAHNEMYRKLIKGYMVRHKVKPGMTGWAQVNGLRGETETVDKMEARVEYDLQYIRDWSLTFDLLIIFRTVLVLLRDRNAY